MNKENNIKEPKRLVTIELRYEDRPVNEDVGGYTTRTITIGIYDTLDEAIEQGNKAIELLSKYFEVRSDDYFVKNALFGMPRTLVSNCCYRTQQIAYFAKITTITHQSSGHTKQGVFNEIVITSYFKIFRQ